jgi:arylsulfatase A-like enzyme
MPRKLTVRLFLAVLNASVLACTGFSAPAEKPNVVFILADDLGWSDTTFNRPNAFYETPNIQRLAHRGLRFTQAYSANPLCSPTRASILTGLYPARIGITAPVCHLPQVILEKGTIPKAAPTAKVLVAQSVTRLKTDYYTLAKALKGAGYATGHFGKWHLGPEPYSPLQQGFDVDFPHWPGPGPAGSYVAPWRFPPALNVASSPGEHIEDRMASEAIAFIRANRDRPFYLNYWAFSVHAPYDAKPKLIEKYRAKAAQLPPGSAQRNPVYGAMVQSLDDNVGRLLDTLDELKIADHTILVFFSDNGGVHWMAGTAEAAGANDIAGIPITSNAPLRGGKATTYEGGTREPCVIVWPGLTKAAVATDTIIQSTDFFPTFADVLKLNVPAAHKFDGRSFAPALRGAAHDRGPTFCHFPHTTPASGGLASTWVRVGDWKLIRFYCLNDDQTDLLELYNLKDDLGETRNLAAQQPGKAKELNALISGFLTDTEAVAPPRNPAYDPAAKAAAAPKAKGKGKNKAKANPNLQ